MTKEYLIDLIADLIVSNDPPCNKCQHSTYCKSESLSCRDKEEVIRWLKAELYPPESIFDLKDKSFENKNTITNNYSNMKGKKKI